mmetsp:Transcript_24264/g.51559  ORF Transcript_24264/g.51559 Transcript_24264/m.51559 type:complete len:294 (-) Transcript_24264:1786-2667(-)|eukprot:CAMPEP_0201256402 /NCGR_PEP_ID=MMETSP0853-20130426/652_1 /ASSEMBLY_ACC=CAM_ASM_000640 /TAXON_ID=183588 /ORGANISM="Pseudo-nitzschia fraudulenta, Strain WWA7" /LENGTH=293 /DNA_ID=CAMNT_0047556621 /DNA_START=256 /DNA_END=1137 /DNA_ORIENTATION=+
MSSASTIPPTHIPCATEWPALSSSKMSSSNGSDSNWELLNPLDASAETSFERDCVRIEDMEGTTRNTNNNDTAFHDDSENERGVVAGDTPICLKHAMSTPDFRHYNTILEESDDDDVQVVDENEGSIASSSMVIVSGPPSVMSSQSSWLASSVSFRDAIMKESTPEASNNDCAMTGTQQQQPSASGTPKMMRKKPKFVVTPIKRCAKSTGDLQSLSRIAENGSDHYGGGDPYSDDHVLGDTDAQLYYNQKAQGKIGRKNGRKIRPDEAKRLSITMAKKEDQRQRQQASASKKR